MCNEIKQRPRHDHSCLLRQYETSQTNSNCKNWQSALARIVLLSWRPQKIIKGAKAPATSTSADQANDRHLLDLCLYKFNGQNFKLAPPLISTLYNDTAEQRHCSNCISQYGYSVQ